MESCSTVVNVGLVHGFGHCIVYAVRPLADTEIVFIVISGAAALTERGKTIAMCVVALF